MEMIFLGLTIGFSLILALGPQNLFVIEQGLKKNNIFIICLICSFSDVFLIFLGIFLFTYFHFLLNTWVILCLNLLLVFFLIHFIYNKISKGTPDEYSLRTNPIADSIKESSLKTLGFTFLNPHVYSDTLFFLGNFSKTMSFEHKVFFGIGACISSFLAFFFLGYGAKLLRPYINNKLGWKIINTLVILIMSCLVFYIFYKEIFINNFKS